MNTGHERSSTPVPEQQFPVHPGLLERDTELTAVTSLIANTLGGGRLLAIEGPPGIGKTALIAEAKALAQEAGLQVLGGGLAAIGRCGVVVKAHWKGSLRWGRSRDDG